MNNYWLIGGAALLALLLIASVIAAVTREEAEFAPGSPEAAVQAYLNALDADDFPAVRDALSPELQAACSIEDMFGGRYPDQRRSILEDKRITLEGSQTFDETTFVIVRITEFRNGDLFGPSGYAFGDSFALKQFDGHWKFSENPWPRFDCARPTPEPSRPLAP